METRDAFGNILENGDIVQVIKDLKVKGSGLVLKQGESIKSIRLTDDEEEVECRIGKANVVLKTMFLKKRN
jgi:protein PhnA